MLRTYCQTIGNNVGSGLINGLIFRETRSTFEISWCLVKSLSAGVSVSSVQEENNTVHFVRFFVSSR